MEIIETNAFHTFYANADDTVKIICPECGLSKSFDTNEYKTPSRGIKARCTCGNVFRCIIEFRKYYRKSVDFAGDYRNEKSGDAGRMAVESISLGGIDFVNQTSGNLIMKNDILAVSFQLDDANQTLIRRKAKVTASENNIIKAEFIKSQPYDKDLGFYLMP
ncbi:MAG: hypothetical protein JRE21_03315 [Deltaproteobacteria bacterium]|jgi:hypothetical protein|nr:hypothetical protein [Deltaproteobacteria bacterium]